MVNRISKINELLQMLMTDSGQYEDIPVSASEREKRNLIRSLMNVRMPKAISDELLNLQGDYLKEELEAKGVVDLSEIPSLKEAYGRMYEEPTGTATLTKSYNLPCDYVIHMVGPIVYGELNGAHCRDLRNCYRNVLECCIENDIKSVAFCCISTGEFHFPNEEAAKIALEIVTDFLEEYSGSMERIRRR